MSLPPRLEKDKMLLPKWCIALRTVLCLFLSLVFLLNGLCKVFPQVHADTFHFLDVAFRNEITPIWQAKVFDRVGLQVHPLVFKFITGNLETFSAIVLWAGGNPRKLVSFFLMCIMASACLTHYWLEQDFTFPLVLLGVSTTVFVLSFETTLVTKASKKE